MKVKCSSCVFTAYRVSRCLWHALRLLPPWISLGFRRSAQGFAARYPSVAGGHGGVTFGWWLNLRPKRYDPNKHQQTGSSKVLQMFQCFLQILSSYLDDSFQRHRHGFGKDGVAQPAASLVGLQIDPLSKGRVLPVFGLGKGPESLARR
eukprot:s1166_g16.t1